MARKKARKKGRCLKWSKGRTRCLKRAKRQVAMAKKHTVLAKKGTRVYKAANSTLTYVGQYKGGGSVFSDLGLKQNWEAYQKARAKLGLPRARGQNNSGEGEESYQVV